MSVLYHPSQVLNHLFSVIGLVESLIQEARTQLDPLLHPKLGAVADVDDTVFITAFRTAALFEEFIHQSNLEVAVQDELIRAVWTLVSRRQVPYLASELLTVTADSANGLQASDWADYWRSGFFTSQHLHREEPHQLVTGLLHLLQAKRIPVGYLTGRHRPSWLETDEPFPYGMVEGTLGNLWRHGLPHGPVVFKPRFRDADREYKLAHFSACLDTEAPGLIPLAYLDNEPGLVNLHDEIMDALKVPHVSVWFNSIHAPTQEPVQLRPHVVVLQLQG